MKNYQCPKSNDCCKQELICKLKNFLFDCKCFVANCMDGMHYYTVMLFDLTKEKLYNTFYGDKSKKAEETPKMGNCSQENVQIVSFGSVPVSKLSDEQAKQLAEQVVASLNINSEVVWDLFRKVLVELLKQYGPLLLEHLIKVLENK